MSSNDGGSCGCILYLILAVVLIGFSLWFTFAIANSGLPFWLKWWILR